MFNSEGFKIKCLLLSAIILASAKLDFKKVSKSVNRSRKHLRMAKKRGATKIWVYSWMYFTNINSRRFYL